MSIRPADLNQRNLVVQQMQKLQAEIARHQFDIGSGLKVQTAKDNPVAAGTIVALQRAEAEYQRFGENAATLASRLQQEETTLTGVTDILSRLREIGIQGHTGTNKQSTRALLLPEVEELQKALLATANTVAHDGRYLFGGSQDSTRPFNSMGNTVVYSGDQSQREIDVAPGQSISDTDPGSSIFLRARTGNGLVAARADSANTGTAALSNDGFTDQSQWDGDTYTLTFGTGTWQALDSASNVVASGSYAENQAMSFRGYQVTLTGQPASGDSFTVGPAPTGSLFELGERLKTAFSADDSASGQSRMNNELYAVLQDLDQALTHVIDFRAGLGARLNTLESAATDREAALLDTRSTISQLRDLDYAEAMTKLAQASSALQAAQQTFARVTSLSLFDVLR